MRFTPLKKCGFLLLLLAALPAQALTIQFGWTPVTTRADGTTPDPGEITGYRVYGVSNLASPIYNLVQSAAGATTSSMTATLADPAAGTCVTYYFVATAVSKYGESAMSTMMTLPICPPKAPAGFSAQYQIIFLGK